MILPDRTTTPASAAGPAGAVLVAEHLTVRKGARTLVHDVGLTVRRGRTLGIVGESGSGKSLTARALVGLLPPGLSATGSARFDGTELIGAGERVLRGIRGARISLLLQDPFTMLNPLQTAGTTIAESLPAGHRRDHAEVRRRLAEVGLAPDVADRHPFQLSGGMRQRVGLAAALAKDPDVLIADEPTTALDVTTQAAVLRLLKEVQTARGMALVLITHDLRVAFSVCDDIQVMYAGSVVERTPAARAATAPAHPYTRGLMLAEPPVGHYVERLETIPGRVPAADAVAGRCAFADRCEWREDVCVARRPELTPLDADRASACARLPEIIGALALPGVTGKAPAAGAAPAAAPAAGRAVATLTGVRKAYRTGPLIGRPRTHVALDGVGFTVAAGESLGLVGETGSGKSTIARILLGLVTPDAGSVELAGIEARDHRRLTREQRRRVRRFVQAVFQDPYASLNPSLRIGSVLKEALEQRGGVTDAEAEVAGLLGRVGLPAACATRLPAALSGGERQRVAIARAVALRPELLICDEPVAALDVSAQAQVLELLREIRRTERMSMLFITHDLAVVRQMTERVIVLHHGEIVESGPTAEVLAAPRHEYTRQLIAAVPGERPPA